MHCRARELTESSSFPRYIVALLEGHVVPNIPYISDAATYSPESCFFGQAINIGCVLRKVLIDIINLEPFLSLLCLSVGITVYVRYKQILELQLCHQVLAPNTARLNRVSLWIGLVSAFGISIVGNFQETNVRVVHLFGALLCFGFGSVYFSLQTILSYYLQPFTSSMAVAHLRMVLSMVCVVFFLLVAIPGVISHIKYDGKDPRHWYPSDGGWMFHVISSVSEWIVATAFCFYILSYTPEFRDIHMEHPKLILVRTTILLIEEGDREGVSSSSYGEIDA